MGDIQDTIITMSVSLLRASRALVDTTAAAAATVATVLAEGGVQATVQPIGSSVFEGSVGRGDVDVLARVAPAELDRLVLALLARGATFTQDQRPSFASLRLPMGELRIGVQAVIAGSEDEAVFSRQQEALADPSVRAAYDRAKQHGAPLGPDGYWRVKDVFWSCRGRPGPTWQPARTPVLKLLAAPHWDTLRSDHTLEGSPADVRDGFVHLSTPAQVMETAARHFAGQRDLWLLTLDADTLGPALRWEPSRGGALFPHLYRALALGDVAFARPFA